jgi:hypothetical protein
MTNRLGWSPTSTDQDVRTATLLQAAYRAIQDAKAMVRYMRMTEATGNIYGIDESKIVLGGQGTGGYISMSYDALDNPSVELNLNKFINFNVPAGVSPVPYVIPAWYGNPDGTDTTFYPANTPPFNFPIDFQWNYPNNPSYSSEINMAFNVGGCLADSSWQEEGDIPMVSFHCAKDENAPYANGDVIVPSTGDFVVEAQGSYIVQKRQDKYLNNLPFAFAGISDPITTQSVANNTTYSSINNYTVGDNFEGLYTFVTPPPSSTPPAQFTGAPPLIWTESGAPWDWWDNNIYEAQAQAVNGPGPAGYFAADAILGNPDMSAIKGNLYLDTIQGYLNPRMYMVLFGGCMDITACNYDASAIVDNGTCLLPDGCTDTLACNYDPFAKCNDGSCLFGEKGCTDMTACNYDTNAVCDDGTCDLPNGCGDPLYVEYDPAVTCSDQSACVTLISTSISEIINQATKIYPNPAKNSINITCNTAVINSISINSINGKNVLNAIVNSNEIKLDISKLAKGIYIVNINSNDTAIKRELVIK